MFVDLTVTVNPMLNVIESHRITEEIERKIGAENPIRSFSFILNPI